ncbi:MAG TPA: hypothetical protein VMY42_22205 [Thermoguttaceae bacterium]|nr:hypothetical protein [Thermoguttaceae bacterium]
MKRILSVLAVTLCPALIGLSAPPHAAAQDVATLQAELAKAQAVNQQLMAKVAELEAMLAKEAAVRAEGQAAGDVAQKMMAVLQQEVQQLRDQMTQLQAERDKNLKSVMDLTDQLHKAFSEMQVLKEQNARLMSLVPNPPTGVPAPPKLDGAVTTDPAGNLIEISLGADAGLKSGHRLTVYRTSGTNRTTLGQIEVLQTAPDKSICRFDAQSLSGEIQKGDAVTTDAASAAPTVTPLSDPGQTPDLVDGEVLSVSAEGEVEISFGASDGLRAGHQLEIYRLLSTEGIYVGRIEVVRTTAKTSFCKAVATQDTIRKGDRVTSKL